MLNILELFKIVFKHPLNKHNKIRALIRLIFFNLKIRFSKKKIIFPWIDEAIFFFDNIELDRLSQRQLKFNYYLGLAEYEDMAFLIHCLKKEDILIDCGANLGLYTILASKVVGANSISFEPHPETVQNLISQIKLNNIYDKVKIFNKAIGDKVEEVNFSNKKDILRRKIIEEENFMREDTIKVSMTTLDHEFKNFTQNFIIKMDLEGSEYKALTGSRSILSSKYLKAVIVENNVQNNDNSIYNVLAEYNFFPIEYFPQERLIKKASNHHKDKLNLIFIRNLNKIQTECVNSKQYKVHPINKYI